MKKTNLAIYWTGCFCLIWLTGCSDSAEEVTSSESDSTPALVAPVVSFNAQPDATATNPRPLEPSVDLSTSATPQQVVQFFLTALQEGNDEQVTGLLTAKARTETEKHDLVVRSPGSPSAEFSVGELEMVSGGAYVNSQWSETAPDGLTQLFDIIWVLRQQTNGWRIAGMATRVAANEQPTYLNFENPKGMIRKWNAADKRLTNQDNPASPDSTTARSDN